MRQVHLDFHTSPYINDVAMDFDAQQFAATFKKAHVESVTVFAKCHHGMNYYPTQIGVQHPALNGRDLLGDMIEALHQEGIRAPIYTTVAWEEDAAHRFPEWRQMKSDGSFANVENSADGMTDQPGRWKFNNWLHPDYQDYIESHLVELLTGYAVDGIFMDIVFFHPQGGWSKTCQTFRKKHGLDDGSLKSHIQFESLAQAQFTERFTKLVHKFKENATVFYNTPNNYYSIHNEGAMRKAAWQTHYEIESLPSGFWGYYHFPRLARRLSHDDKPWLGMTGKFQRMWGDFGGLKPQAALEYECFRSQAMGGGNSVGDQLHPRGELEPATYDLVRSVYQQVQEAEPFYEDSTAIPQIGVLCPNYPGHDENETAKSEEGVILMLEELHYDCAVIDDVSDFTQFELVVLPDCVVVNEILKQKISDYYRQGGKLLISYTSGFDENQTWRLDVLPIKPKGDGDLYPTYWHVCESFNDALSNGGDRVIYSQGLNVKPTESAPKLVSRILPYFNRTDVTFCSHFQTPPNKKDNTYAAVIGNENFIYFADPIFKEYRQAGNVFIRQVLKTCIEKLIGAPLVGEELSPSILSVPRRKKNDLIVTLLNYIPVRKALDIDVIEQGQSFVGEIFKVTKSVNKIYSISTNTYLEKGQNDFHLPNVKGRLLLCLKDFYKSI